MKIVTRINPLISPTANDWITDKFEAVKICHTSLLNVGAKNYENHFLLDDCPAEYSDYFSQFGVVNNLKIGNKRESVAVMLKYGKGLNDDILFLEDDYLWRPNFDLKELEEDIKTFGVIAPYDHPAHYLDTSEAWMFKPVGYKLYRDCKTSTHTFACKREIMEEEILWWALNFGEHDWIMWLKLRQNSISLYSPVPGYAMHLAKDAYPLGFDYYNYYLKLKGINNDK